MGSTHTPIILLGGQAGCGKDTAGAWLAEKYNGITLAQADPLKRFVKDVFGFSEEWLWGPSELRNTIVDLSDSLSKTMADFESNAENWVEEVLPESDPELTIESLQAWFDKTLSFMTENPISPRMILQTLGTEWGREQDPYMWINYAISVSMALLEGGVKYSRTEGIVDDTPYVGSNFAIITDGRFRNEILTVKAINGVAMKIERQTDSKTVEAAGIKGHKSESELGTIPSHFFSSTINNNGSLAGLYYHLAESMRYHFDVAPFSKAAILTGP